MTEEQIKKELDGLPIKELFDALLELERLMKVLGVELDFLDVERARQVELQLIR